MKKLRRTLIGVLVLIIAIPVQLVIVNRLSLPGGGVPDLVLIAVTALGVINGRLGGMLAGFFGGLALDIAPPGSHLAGEYALVFCLAGYCCGRLRGFYDTSGEQATMGRLAVMAAGTVAGEAGKVAIGLLVSDPQVTGPVVEHVLPSAAAYDLVLCPFALWLISFLSGRAAPGRGRVRVQVLDPHVRPKLLSVPQSAGVFRLASEGGVPRLRLADARVPALGIPVRREPKRRISFGGALPRAAPARREPRLRLSSGRSNLASRTTEGAPISPSILAGGRPARVNFSSRGRWPGTASSFGRDSSRMAKPGKGWLRAGKRDGWLNRGSKYGTGSVSKYRYRGRG
jgi:rod shape-determining protein MreD